MKKTLSFSFAILMVVILFSRLAVRFEYEYHDEVGNWFRAYGNENWGFDENGLMAKRYASINDLPIKASERKL